MLLSRFWYVVLAAVAGIAIAGAALVHSTYERDRGRDSELLLRGDRRQIDEFMRTEARVRLDNLVPVASNPDFTRVMNTAATRANDGPALRDAALRVSQQLETLNRGMGADAQGQMLIAVDARGFVVGRAGMDNNAGIGDYLGGVPLVSRAIDGYVRDDTWELRGRVYRMAARPVIYQGRYVGAVVHAREIDNAFVHRISEALGGASVAFFASSGVYASDAGQAEGDRIAPTPDMLATQVHALPQNREWNERGYTDVLRVNNGQGAAVYGTLAGTVGLDGGGFAVGRPRPVLRTDYLLHAPSDEVKHVPWGVVIGLMLGSTLLGLLFIYLEHDRGDAQLRAALQALAERKVERLDPLKLRGNARKTALAINDAFERAMKEELARTGGKPRRNVEDLDALLGPAPGAAAAQPFMDIPPPPPPSAGAPMPAPMPAPPPARPAGPPAPPPAPMGAAPRPPAPPPPAPPVPAPRALPATAPKPPLAPGFTDSDEEPTNIARRDGMGIPAALLPNAGAGRPATPGGPLESGASDAEEQAHWREVFDQFVATKKQCNEPVETLVFEKFAATLVRHKEQLVARTKCRAVRFQVYVKDGKATLKATPVK